MQSKQLPRGTLTLVLSFFSLIVVRIPLNQDCWLNINGVNPQYGGENYINAIYDFVVRLNNHGINAILDLHWTAPGNQQVSQKIITN